MKTQSRLKKFNGLPHELEGLDYTYDAEVEGGEVAYTPKGSKDEFIFRKKSSNIKELEKQDKLRSKRPEGDRISDISFDAIAKNLMLEESKQLASEGIDPFNGSKDVFATGGVNFYEPDPMGEVPQIVDTPATQPSKNTMSAGQAGGYAAAVGGLASSLGQLGAEDPYYSQGVGQKDVGTQALESTTDSIVGAIPLVGQFYGAGKGISSGIEAGRDDARSKDNVAGAEAAAFGAGFVDPAGSWFDLAADEKNGTLTSGQHVGAGFLNILMPGTGDAYAEKFRKQHAQSQEKQAGYDATLAERGLIPQSNEVVRNRTQEFKNGGMRKKYAGTNGSVRNTVPKDDYIDPALGYPNLSTEYLRGIQPEVVVNGNNTNGWNDPIDQEDRYAPYDPKYNSLLIDSSLTTSPQGDVPKVADNKKFKFDPNMLTSIAGGLGQMIPSIAYLAGDGKDYDRVKYPTYRPDTVTADLPLRENRDAFASARDAMRQQGKLDLGALSALATQESKGRSGVRENIANVNTGIKNDAQLKNIGFDIQAMTDEAMNKGAYQTNKQQALQNLTGTLAGNTRQAGMMSNDELVKQRFTELFGEV